ncbi:hypothetical protein R1flu_014352 [Riccia fluitans]|uniref:Uncharacterized protein n=1 Tax=Riccia fluitans TaxID=41844 RepID=A0ABD1YFV7_9MARC
MSSLGITLLSFPSPQSVYRCDFWISERGEVATTTHRTLWRLSSSSCDLIHPIKMSGVEGNKMKEAQPVEATATEKQVPYICLLSFTNSELLLHANVDTSSCSVLLFRYLWPSEKLSKAALAFSKNVAALAVILAGSVIYVGTDSQFRERVYRWAVLGQYVRVELVYIKHIVMTIGLKTWDWCCTTILKLCYSFHQFIMGEGMQLKHLSEDHSVASSMTVWFQWLSCLFFRLSISFLRILFAEVLSATSFTVLGVVNKLPFCGD